MVYYLLFLAFPFVTETDEEDRARYIIEGDSSQTPSFDIGDEKMMETTTTPVAMYAEDKIV